MMFIMVADIETEKVENSIVGIGFPIPGKHIVFGDKMSSTRMNTTTSKNL